MVELAQSWLVVGADANWRRAFEDGIWGLQDVGFMQAHWGILEEGDYVLFYVKAPVSGVVGCGRVTTKFRQTNPLWPDEIAAGKVLYPLRFEFEVEYCLPASQWRSDSYQVPGIKPLIRNGFQCVSNRVRHEARRHFGLIALAESERPSGDARETAGGPAAESDHEDIKRQLADIGRIQGFLAEEEYPIDGKRLDVVWRRVAASVPTYAFEVQVGGDIYHALAKLKHAYDLWNSHIFLVAGPQARHGFDELVSGTFHEIQHRVKFLTVADVLELHRRKTGYRDLEQKIGILQQR